MVNMIQWIFIPLVLQKVDPDFPPLAAQWTQLASDLMKQSSPSGQTSSLSRLNWSAKNTRQWKVVE